VRTAHAHGRYRQTTEWTDRRADDEHERERKREFTFAKKTLH